MSKLKRKVIPMKIAIVQGSTRQDSQSAKIAMRLGEKVRAADKEVEIIDLHKAQLPIFDDTDQPAWKPIGERLLDTDAFILVTPEWNGSAGPGMMNFLTYTSRKSQKQLAHRPVVIVSVSSGAGGSYPIAQLKAYGNKNNHPVFVPEHIRIRDVKNVLNGEQPVPGNEIDESLHVRINHMLDVLFVYAEKLADIRSSGVIDLESYPNGN